MFCSATAHAHRSKALSKQSNTNMVCPLLVSPPKVPSPLTGGHTCATTHIKHSVGNTPSGESSPNGRDGENGGNTIRPNTWGTCTNKSFNNTCNNNNNNNCKK